MFQMARWVVFTKLDLLPHVPFKLERAVDLARAVNPDLGFLMTSAMAANGLGEWLSFCRAQARRRRIA
jgi:hydrogenase nickel incorporation protein HypB